MRRAASTTRSTTIRAPPDRTPTVSNLVPLDANGNAYGRLPGDALNIVYLTNNAAMKGGFFSNGVNVVNGELNGELNVSSAFA